MDNGSYQGRIIETLDDVAEGAQWLCTHDARFKTALEQCPPLPLRRKPDGFTTLLDAITGQQISTQAAAAIWARIEVAGLTTPAPILAASDDELRAVGFSLPKIRYARALAAAEIDYAALRTMPDAEVLKTLTTVPGIGQWTAEIYAMFALGRADVFAHGDLALQEAAKTLLGLDARPTAREMRDIAALWSPWRSVAARLLWAYYRVAKHREGIR